MRRATQDPSAPLRVVAADARAKSQLRPLVIPRFLTARDATVSHAFQSSCSFTIIIGRMDISYNAAIGNIADTHSGQSFFRLKWTHFSPR